VLHLHRSHRADALAAALAELLADPPADPFTRELIAVPTRGIERWLTQHLAGALGAADADGICAGVEFPFPGRVIDDALAAASDIDPATDPWQPDRLVWPLLEIVDAAIEEPWLSQLAVHLRAEPERRFARVAQLTRLLHGYGIRRPELIQTWARGEDWPAENAAWQAELWRRLRERIGVPSQAERLIPACARLRSEPGLIELPPRLALFGLTRLPPSYVAVLSALATGRDVHLLLLHPSAALWSQAQSALPDSSAPRRRADDPTASITRNRLLASWGRDVRELQTVLSAAGPIEDHPPPAPWAVATPTLLGRLQQDVRANQMPPGPPLPGRPEARVRLAPDDRSVQIHACHGRTRQVEVMREAILHRLAADPTLEPRDVIVMCPDVENFAPLIEATFGPVGDETGEDPLDLRVRLADRSLRQTNPLLGVLARLLELAGGRVTASEVLDLLDSGPLRRRFDCDDDDLDRIRAWITEAGVHWGVDTEHRAEYRLAEVPTGTWAAGLRRLLLGVAQGAADGRMYEGVLPVDDVQSGAIALAGRFAEFIDRLATTLADCARSHTVAGWAEVLASAAAHLTSVPDDEAWQQRELDRILGELTSGSETVTRPGGGPGTVQPGPAGSALSLAEARFLLADRLAGRPTRTNFRTGDLTVCTLQPMRSVPHRVVCLLGIDDGSFPRKAWHEGDDLLLADPHIGDRDSRAEDRQLLLDALMAAGEALIVTYSGNDERTNARRPPAVPIGELLDVIAATAIGSGGGDARAQVELRHPLQAFDPRNFRPGRLAGDQPWSFDAPALSGALAFDGARAGAPPFLATPLPPLDEGGVLALDELVAFFRHPVRGFLRQRLELSTFEASDELDDALPVELDGLERWKVGQRLLEASLAGRDVRATYLPEVAGGALPPGLLGQRVIEQTRPGATLLARQALAAGGDGEARSLEANVTLADGTRLAGTVSGVRGNVLLTVSYSRLRAAQRLESWIRLLALTAAHPEVPFEAVTVGRPAGGGTGASIARIGQLARLPQDRRAFALNELTRLTVIRARGLREPLPLPCETGALYAADRLGSGASAPERALAAAESAWCSTFDFDRGEWWEREDREPEHVLAFGGELPLLCVYALVPGADENGEGWPADEPSRFGRYAVALWKPLLERERVSVV
jgi:exodeoxyribonuclease V gamma subunit